MLHWYILNGHEAVPVPTIVEWIQWMATLPNQVVAQEMVGDLCVSTIFLGLDNRHIGNGPPLIFETMIFGPDRHLDIKHQTRCSTWDEAVRQHAFAKDLALTMVRDLKASTVDSAKSNK